MNYQDLKNELNLAAKSYYLLNTPLMDDNEYDLKYKELLNLESNQGFGDKDSPTQKVGYSGLNNEKEHDHGRMLSLDNVTTSEELATFFDSNTDDLLVMPKLDGLAMALYYKFGKLQKALLRGDGVSGADVTSLAIQMSGVPTEISTAKAFRVVGEIVSFSNHWVGDYKNHRNYVSGSMNKVDTENFAERALSFVSFDYSLTDYSNFSKKLKHLNSIGGFIVIDSILNPTQPHEELRELFKSFFPYCDGLVYVQENTDILLGVTSHHPYNKVAFKFKEEAKYTKLLGVTWEMGRTKTLTPVALLEPVVLGGATVTRASLSNIANIERRGIAINDLVAVIKAKEIIPQVLYAKEQAADRIKIEITKCPVCLHDVSITNTGIVSCTNKMCGGSSSKSLTHFLKAVGVKGIGITIAEQLSETQSILDVLSLDDADLCAYSNIAEANAPKAVKSIKESFSQPRWKAWVGLGIPLCGRSLCEKLPVTSLLDLTGEVLLGMPKVAEKTASSIMFWINDNKPLIRDIEALYTNTEKPVPISGDFKKVYITGTLSLSRARMKPLLLEKGMTIMTSLSRNTDIFLAGRGAKQHKIDKARELGVEILYEKDL